MVSRLLPLLRPPDGGRHLLLASLQVGRPGEGPAAATVLVCLVHIILQQRLLPASGCQLLTIQGTITITRIRYGPLEPVPLLHYCEWLVLCSTNCRAAAQPYTIIITIIAVIQLLDNTVRHHRSGGIAIEQLCAIVRSDTRTEEEVYAVLIDYLLDFSFLQNGSHLLEFGITKITERRMTSTRRKYPLLLDCISVSVSVLGL